MRLQCVRVFEIVVRAGKKRRTSKCHRPNKENGATSGKDDYRRGATAGNRSDARWWTPWIGNVLQRNRHWRRCPLQTVSYLSGNKVEFGCAVVSTWNLLLPIVFHWL